MATLIKTKGLEDSAITSAKINDGAVTSAKLNSTLNLPTDATVNATPSQGDDSTKVATTAFVQSELSLLAQGMEFQDSVIDKDLTAPPGSPSTGDRYLLGLDSAGSAMTGAWAGQDGDIAEWNGSSWDFTTPTTGMAVLADDESDKMYIFGSTLWAASNFESTTASEGLIKSGFDVQIDSLGVSEAKIAALAVTEGKIGALAVTEAKIGALAVTEAKIGALAVTEGKIAGSAVTSAKIASNAVTEAKLGSDVDAESLAIATGYDASGASGNVAVSDSVQAAMEKIEKKADDALAGGSLDPINEVITLIAGDITAKAVDLSGRAADDVVLKMSVLSVGEQEVAVDYVSSVNGAVTQIDWDGLGLDGFLAAGDKLAVSYMSV